MPQRYMIFSPSAKQVSRLDPALTLQYYAKSSRRDALAPLSSAVFKRHIGPTIHPAHLEVLTIWISPLKSPRVHRSVWATSLAVEDSSTCAGSVIGPGEIGGLDPRARPVLAVGDGGGGS
jgi:hypothetical protein